MTRLAGLTQTTLRLDDAAHEMTLLLSQVAWFNRLRLLVAADPANELARRQLIESLQRFCRQRFQDGEL